MKQWRLKPSNIKIFFFYLDQDTRNRTPVNPKKCGPITTPENVCKDAVFFNTSTEFILDYSRIAFGIFIIFIESSSLVAHL